MDVVGIGLFFGASIIAGTIRDGYVDWLLPAREQPPADPPVVTVIHLTVTVTRRIIRTTPTFVTVFESVPTYITLAAEPYHKIWSLSWTNLLQCFGPFLMFLLFVLLMFSWLGHNDTADTAPVDGADSPPPPSSPQPSGAKSSEHTIHENPDPHGHTAQGEPSSDSPSSTGSTRVGTGFFRRSKSVQTPQTYLSRLRQRPVHRPQRIPRRTTTRGQEPSAGPAAGQSLQGSGTGNALRNAITLGRASRFTAGTSDGAQDSRTESDVIGTSRSGDPEVPGLIRRHDLERSSSAAPDSLPPYVPSRQPDPDTFKRPYIVEPHSSRTFINRHRAQSGDALEQASSSAPSSSRPLLSNRDPAHQHVQGPLDSAGPTTSAVDSARSHPAWPYRSIGTPLSFMPPRVLPHSGGIGSALDAINEDTSAQDSQHRFSGSYPGAAPDDDSDLIEFSGLEPALEDNLPGRSMAGLNATQQHGWETGLLGGHFLPADQDLDLEDGAFNCTLGDSGRLGSAPQGGRRSESSELVEADSSDEDDDEDLEFEDLLENGPSIQSLGHRDWTNPLEERASERIANLLITVPDVQQNVDDEDTSDAVGSASEGTFDHEDEQNREGATQSERTVPSRSSGQPIGPGLATSVTSPMRTTDTGVPSSQPAPVTPQRSIASDEHDELYYLTPAAEQRRGTRVMEISRSLEETLSNLGGAAGSSDLNGTRSEEANGQEQEANIATIPANSSEAAVTGPLVTEQAAPIEARSRSLYVDFMGQTGTLRTSATSSEAPPFTLPADVWSSQPFLAPTPVSSTTNSTDREQETYPLRSLVIAQVQIPMQGHTPPRVEDFSSPSAQASQDSSSAYTQWPQENRHLLTLPHPAKEEVFEPEMPSVRDVDNNPHFWAPGERSQARRLRELPSPDPGRLPIHESALDHSYTPPRDETTATEDFGTPSSPEDGLVQPSSTALVDPFTEASSEPSAPREARGSIAFSVPPSSNRAEDDETDAENGGGGLDAQEVYLHQQGLAPSRPATAEPTTPTERTVAGNSVTPNTASSAATQIITSPHSGTSTRDCPHWISGNFCADEECRLIHDPEKLKRDRNGKVLCSYFLKGRCNKGNGCGNSHDMSNQNGNTTQQPSSTAPVVPTQALQAPQVPQAGAGSSRLVPRPVTAAPVAPAQAVQESQAPQASAGFKSSTQQPILNVQPEPEASQPTGEPSRTARRNDDEQVGDILATMSTGLSTSMWANDQHGRRRSRSANGPSNVQARPRPADVQAQSATGNLRPEGAATGFATTSNDQGDHNSVPQNAASNPQANVTATQSDAGSHQNNDQIVINQDAASNTQLDSAPAEPATALGDQEGQVAAPHNASLGPQPQPQPANAYPEPVTASSDDSGRNVGPQVATPHMQPGSAASNPVIHPHGRTEPLQSVAPDSQPDSPPQEPATASNGTESQSAAAQNTASNLHTGSARPEQAAGSNNNSSGIAVPRDPETAASRVQRDPEELAVQRMMANMASGTSHSMWADEDTGQPDDALVVNQKTHVSSNAQGQQAADANENETGSSQIEQEPAANVVDDFHRAILPEDDDSAGEERRLLNAIGDLEKLISENEEFIARNGNSRNKKTLVKVNTKRSGLRTMQEFLKKNRDLLSQLRQGPLEGTSRQVNQPQQNAEADGPPSDQPNVRPPEDGNSNQGAKKPKGKEKQTDASLNNDFSISAATTLPGQESRWSDQNYVAPSKRKGTEKQKQQQKKKKNTTSEASITASAAAPSALPRTSILPPAQPQSVAGIQSSTSTQAPMAAEMSANTPASEQDQFSQDSQVSGNTRAATNPQSSSDDVAASTPYVDRNGPAETGFSETPNSSGVPEDSSQPESSNTPCRRVNTVLVPDYTKSNSAQNAVRSLGQKPQVPKMQDSAKDAKSFSWANEFDDTETFAPKPETKQAKQAPQRQTPASAQDTGNPQRQPAPSKPEEKSPARFSVQSPSEAEQKLMNQIQRLEKKNSNDRAIMQQCLSSGNVSKAKQLQEQDIPYNEAGLLHLRANLKKINPGNPLLQQKGAQNVLTAQPANSPAQSTEIAESKVMAAGSNDSWSESALHSTPDTLNGQGKHQLQHVGAHAANVQDDKKWVTDAPDDDAR
ncbi:hypothetical protein AC579_7079 [Pseudocercospora musae]|uniref:C3H1-type domain-containing protein n=1 Tax=Pseudocercospora musae TaxID=113226 RepID=A0A139HLM1_9PEZI|nr:hypothetical protein AC579_7079 [Pseudocercospora musae]